MFCVLFFGCLDKCTSFLGIGIEATLQAEFKIPNEAKRRIKKKLHTISAFCRHMSTGKSVLIPTTPFSKTIQRQCYFQRIYYHFIIIYRYGYTVQILIYKSVVLDGRFDFYNSLCMVL